MGFRHRFQLIEKEKVEELRKLSSENLIDWCNKNGVECNDGWVAIYNIGKQIFDFGKFYENSAQIRALGSPLFIDDSLEYLNDEYELTLVSKEAFEAAINFQKKQILSYYNGLLFPDKQEVKTREANEEYNAFVYKSHLEDMFFEWENFTGNCFAIDTDLSSKKITKSDKYEYSIFELAFMYKNIDFEKYSLVFLGW